MAVLPPELRPLDAFFGFVPAPDSEAAPDDVAAEADEDVDDESTAADDAAVGITAGLEAVEVRTIVTGSAVDPPLLGDCVTTDVMSATEVA